MPPRVRLSHLASSNQIISTSTSSVLACDLRTTICAARRFSQSTHNSTRLRKDFYSWLDGPGRVFKDPLPGSTNYISAYDRSGNLTRLTRERSEEDAENAGNDLESELDEDGDEDGPGRQERKDGIPKERPSDLRPYPENRMFLSQSVLSEELREQIYQRVVVDGKTVTEISSHLRVSLERVAAVVRLKTIEKQWQEQGKPLAKVYSRAVLAMLPTTSVTADGPPSNHEPITDIPIVSSTGRQTFYSVPESEHFTRKDAAAVFHPKLKPVDERIPHKELILAEQLRMQGNNSRDVSKQVGDYTREQDESRKLAKQKREEFERLQTKVHEGRRWNFKIKDMNVDDVGTNGRSPKGEGWRYGMPHQDRKRAQVKIPTEVIV